MKTKTQTHTPGPWTAHIPQKKDGRQRYFPTVCIGECRRYEGHCIGRISINEAGKQENGDDDLGEFDYNAHLIAAAPDLLNAARRGLAEMTVNGHGNVSESCEKVCAICDSAKDLRAAIAKAEGR